jgi:hypothetical protein
MTNFIIFAPSLEIEEGEMGNVVRMKNIRNSFIDLAGNLKEENSRVR